MTSRFIEPMNFREIYLNYFLGGSTEIFAFALVIFISYLCAYFRMPNNVFLVILALGLIMFTAFIGQAIYALVLFVIGFFAFKMLVRIFG